LVALSAFIASLEDDGDEAEGEGHDGELEAAGGELALGAVVGDDGEDDCAKAAETIRPLSAVVTNNFLSIG
jgi:hypothetical protein